jgi:putative transposase
MTEFVPVLHAGRLKRVGRGQPRARPVRIVADKGYTCHHKRRGTRRWKRLQRRKKRFLAQQKRRTRDIEHKVSRAVIEWAQERKAGMLAIGAVRDVAEGKRLAAKSQQKISLWSHAKMRQYITYKADVAGIRVELIDEHDTSKPCPCCGRQYTPRGRIYRCATCGLVAHRDVVGCVNFLSRKHHGALAKIAPPPLAATKYRYPPGTGKRGRPDTAELARVDTPLREVAGHWPLQSVT